MQYCIGTYERFAQLLIEKMRFCIAAKGHVSLVLCGGATPLPLYTLLLEKYSDTLDWSSVRLFFGDERCVPPTDKESNYRNAMAIFGQEPLVHSAMFRMQAELDPEQAALDYERIVRQEGSFDIVLLGVGDDGHTASLFPGTAALTETSRFVVSNWVESKDCFRITMTFPFLQKASNIYVLVTGSSKAQVVYDVVRTPSKGFPIQTVMQFPQTTMWVDKEAARLCLEDGIWH